MRANKHKFAGLWRFPAGVITEKALEIGQSGLIQTGKYRLPAGWPGVKVAA